MNNSNIIDLKAKLASELQKENSDNDIILHLSNEIARLDETQIRFTVDAGIINRLGKELVGRHETAVSELVKNSFDADSTEVILTFENASELGGTLLIEDNGHGMTRDQLINGFMRLSSSDKIHNPISPKFKRTRAGKKGIGRFATQRLGESLIIITQTSENQTAYRLTIKWNTFETDKDLATISNKVEAIPKIKNEGTTLIIKNLREAWSDAMIKRVYRYTSDLLQPFPLSKKSRKDYDNSIDPGFKSTYFRKDGNSVQRIIDEEEAFFNHALAEIEGYVLDDGQGCWSLKSKKLNFPEEVFLIGKYNDDLESKFKHISGVHFKCYYFIYDSSLLSAQTKTFIQSIANEKGGIRLYRNGFRVLPYGERGNDWLGLDEEARRRVILGPIQKINFFGFVEIIDQSSSLFDETSSREGVVENDAFHELTDFVLRSIVNAVLKVAELRNRKGKAGQKNWVRKENTPSEKVDNAITKLKEIFNDTDEQVPLGNTHEEHKKEESNSRKEKFTEVFQELIESREEEKLEKKELIDELNMMRILAGLGLVIGEFVHEIKNYFPGIDAETSFLRNALKEFKEGIERVNILEKNVKSLTAYSSYFDEAISRNVLRELEPIELRDAVSRFEAVIQSNLEKSKISFNKPIFEGFDLFTIPMHPSEWASILFNFYTNSKKAIKRAGVKGHILIKGGREDGNVFLEFSDNGDGILKGHEEIIFNAFYTTSSVAGRTASEVESLTGTGLGLKIVKDIVESYNGNVYITIPPEGYTTTFRIEIPEFIIE